MAATQSTYTVASIKIARMKTVPRGVRLIAALEAGKAVLVLAAGFGLLKLLHHDVAAVVAHVITRLHLNPANKYPHIFIDAASHLTDAHLWSLAALALVYSIRFRNAGQEAVPGLLGRIAAGRPGSPLGRVESTCRSKSMNSVIGSPGFVPAL